MTTSTSLRTGTTAALITLGLLTSCGDPGPYGYGHSDDKAAAAPTAKATGNLQGVIRGVVDWPGDNSPQGFANVFILGRRQADARLPDLIQRLPAGPFPMHFEVSARDLAGPGTLGGEWFLEARLDKDGVAVAQNGDFVGRAKGALRTGSDGAVLMLDQQVTQDEDPAMLRELALAGMGGPVMTQAAGSGASGLPAGHPPIAGSTPAPAATSVAAHSGPSAASQQPPKMPGPRFAGTVEVDAKVASAARGGVLYIMLKQGLEARGMPRAVFKVVDPTFPLAFDIGPEHVPLDVDNKADMLLGTLYASVRLDKDGNVMTKNPGDLEMSTTPPAVTADGEPTTLRLDEVHP